MQDRHFLHQLVSIIIGHRHGDRSEAVKQDFLLAFGNHVFPNRFALVQIRLLRQIAHFGAICGACFAVKVLVNASHDFEQARFTRPVDTDNADLGVGIKRQPNVLKHFLAARIRLGQTLHLEDMLSSHGEVLSVELKM